MKSSRLFAVNFFMKLMPPTRCFAIKRYLLKWSGAIIGKNVKFSSSAQFLLTGTLSIGSDTWIGYEVLMIGGDSSISIGEACDIGPRVTFVTGTHEIDPDGLHTAGKGYSLPIVINNGCWIGAGATILGGTKIGKKSIIAAGAVVKGDFPEGCLIGGIPARVLRSTLAVDKIS
jgi:acetyltransferase-like isoleucine patch superfamily enzyme